MNDGYHPKFVIMKVRYSTSLKEYKGLTVGNKSVTLSNVWIDQNIAFPNATWYVDNLEPQFLSTKSNSKKKWFDLPIGKKYVFDTATLSSEKSPYTERYCKETKAINAYQFRYLQENYGDVCTLINVVNVLHYIEDPQSERILAKYLNDKTWKEFVKNLTNGNDKATGYELGNVMKLLRDKCSYTIIKHKNEDPVKYTIDNPFVVRISHIHAIVIYKNMIFDANNRTMIARNHMSMSSYSVVGIKTDHTIHNTTCYEFRMEKKSKKKNRISEVI